VRKLAQLFPPNADRPTLLRTADPNSWYTVVAAEAERVLIPCFELLRAFYYQATGGLSSYFFSRLPLDTLCWPVAAPVPANDFTAHFCVAATLRHQQEARVLAELLFNPACRTGLQLAQAHLALVWHRCQQAHRPAEAHAKVDLRLGRAVAVAAYGASFTVGSQAYFWVSRLVPPPQWFGFQRVVYHPLAPKLPLDLPFAASVELAFTDILHERRATQTVVPAAGLPADFRHFGRYLRAAAITRPAGPPVVRAFPWATCCAAHRFADGRSQDDLWGRPGYCPVGTAVALPVNPLCEQLLHCLQEKGCLVQRIEVNNPAQQFGPGQSVFPYACPPITQTHLPDRRQRPLTIARLGWGGGNFYLFSVLDAEEVVLVYRADLASWRSEDYHRFLLQTVENLFDWRAAGQRLAVLTGQPHIVCVKWQQSADRLAWAFHQQAIGAVAYYNWQASKEQALQNLPPLPAGSVAQAQAVHQVRLAAGKRTYPGNYIGEPPTTTKLPRTGRAPARAQKNPFSSRRWRIRQGLLHRERGGGPF